MYMLIIYSVWPSSWWFRGRGRTKGRVYCSFWPNFAPAPPNLYRSIAACQLLLGKN